VCIAVCVAACVAVCVVACVAMCVAVMTMCVVKLCILRPSSCSSESQKSFLVNLQKDISKFI